MKPSRAIPLVVQQHVEDSAHLRAIRTRLVRAPHLRLHALSRWDDRLVAHLDGTLIAGDVGSTLCQQALAPPSNGALFAATVQAIETRDEEFLQKLLSIASISPPCRNGLVSAFGWVPPERLRGLLPPLLTSSESMSRQIAISACAMHGVAPPGQLLAHAAESHDDPDLNVRASRASAALGRSEMRPLLVRTLARATVGSRAYFEAARSAVILGDRSAGLEALRTLSSTPGPWRPQAIELLLKCLGSADSLHALKALHQEGSQRLFIRAVGIGGDSHFVPWLISQMNDRQTARIAGAAFSAITGLDLSLTEYEQKPPEGFGPGPSDDPQQDDVAIDDDDDLPWPDPRRLAQWWQETSAQLPPGTRYFMGESPTLEHCQRVLLEGFQAQRRQAAEYLCLLQPGSKMFNVAAPSRRQAFALGYSGTG